VSRNLFLDVHFFGAKSTTDGQKNKSAKSQPEKPAEALATCERGFARHGFCMVR
jgi:hypothetical protein